MRATPWGAVLLTHSACRCWASDGPVRSRVGAEVGLAVVAIRSGARAAARSCLVGGARTRAEAAARGSPPSDPASGRLGGAGGWGLP